MIKIKETIVVEGKYDIIKLKNIVDTHIVETKGFSIFHDDEKLKFLRFLAEKNGLIILTDSDGAGFIIRNYLKGALPKNRVSHAYIPDLFGKEKRKTKRSKEGKLGVEGIKESVLIDALLKASATFLDNNIVTVKRKSIKKIHLYEANIYGREGSETLRKQFQKFISLPEHLSVNALVDVLNMIYDLDEFYDVLKDFQDRG